MRKATTIAALTFSIGSTAIAGMPARPYFAWINPYENERPHITPNIEKYIDSQPDDEFCGKTALWWIAYVNKKPAGITEDLVQKALEAGSKRAQASIAKSITLFRDKDVDSGLDGIIAYVENPAPHMASIDAREKIIKSNTIKNPEDPQQVISAFCAVIPKTYRR